MSDARRLVAMTHSTYDPASRFRVLQYLPHLEAAGWRVEHRPNRPPRPPRRAPGPLHRWLGPGQVRRRERHRLADIKAAAGADVVWANRDLLAGQPRYEALLQVRNPHVVFDVDDAVWLTDKAGHFPAAVAGAAWVLAGNETLAAEARRHSERVSVLPTVIETDRYRVAAPRDPSRPLRLGWCGSRLSIEQTLFPLLPLLARLQPTLGFELVVMSWPRPRLPASGLRWRYVAWSPERETRLGDYFDVGLMPLQDTPFQRAKCGCKLLQYLACGLPAVATPLGVNETIAAGSGAVLTPRDERGWEEALGRLYEERETLPARGAAGRAWCEREMSLQRWLPELRRVLDRVAGG